MSTKNFERLPTPEEGKEEIDLSRIRCGYIVALSDTGDLIFETLGKDQGVVEMLGLHEFAAIKLRRPFNEMVLERTNQTLQTMSRVIAQGFLAQKPDDPANQ